MNPHPLTLLNNKSVWFNTDFIAVSFGNSAANQLTLSDPNPSNNYCCLLSAGVSCEHSTTFDLITHTHKLYPDDTASL